VGIFKYWLWTAGVIRDKLKFTFEGAVPHAASDEPAVTVASDGAREQVAAFYQERTEQIESERTEATRTHARYLRYATAWFAVLAVLFALSLGIHVLPMWSVVFPLIPAAFFLEKARRNTGRNREVGNVLAMYQRRLSRVRHEWMGRGDQGLDLRVPEHLSAQDLDLFGDGSMFELLCDVDTPAGREILAKWLQFPGSATEVISRQDSVRWLRERTDLREKLAALREGEASEYSWSSLRDWLVADAVRLPRWAPTGRLLLSLAMVIVVALWWAGVLVASSAVWAAVAIAAAEIALALSFRRRVRSILAGLHLPVRKVESLRRLCALVQGEQFRSARLAELQIKLHGSVERIATLQRLVRLLSFRDNEWLVWPYFLLLGTTQVASRIEWWRQRHGLELVEWITVLGEFEALMAIAAYACENPEDPFPELAEDGPLFEATDMGHPLMDARTCVRNDVALGREPRFLLVTGSNMSGKSTLLRAVGLNATLAWMGAPVRASRLRLSEIQICVSIRIEDSLLHGASRFYAEVQRLKAMLEIAKSGAAVLFLIDELFGGTNSADRRVAAEAVIRSLAEHGAIGLVTSHDLALSEISEMRELRGENVHFTDLSTADGQMTFDYRIRRGKLERGNALKIIKLVGLLPE
jgi:hypothetical protein